MRVEAFTKFLLAIAASIAGPSAAYAQSAGSLERTVPKFEVQPEKQSRVATPTVAREASSRIASTFVLSAVNLEGATAISSEELAKSFEPFLASRVGQAELDKIANDLTDRYRAAGYLLSYAVVPEQSVQSGIVRIRVVEGYIDQVRLEGDNRSALAIQDIVERIASDRPLRSVTLERILGLVRDLPGVTVLDTRISRSPADPARHQLTIKLGADRVRGLLYSDNRGTADGARVRAFSTVGLSSLAIPGDQLQLDLFSIPSDDFRFVHGQARFSAPLNDDGLRLTVSASRGDSFRRFKGPNQHGKSRQLIADLAYPLVKSRAFSLVGRASLGEWKSEEEFSQITFQRDRYQVARGWVEFTRAKKTRIDGRFAISRGLDLGSATESGDPRASRPFAGARFTKFNADVQIATALSKRVVLRFDATAQYSTEPLLAAEEFALGGSRIGRAFDFNEVAGDHGFGALAEIRYVIGDTKHGPKSLEAFAYADGGGAFRKRSFAGLPDKQWLASAGAGLRFSALGLLWSGEVGVPIARTRVDRGPRLFFSVVKSF